MDADLARRLASTEGSQAVAAAQAESDPDSLGAAERLRSRFDPDLAAAALDQAAMRRRAMAKIGPAGEQMLWTRDGLEQATRGAVSAWRADRLVAAGVRRVVDLGCACGADSRACLDAGLDVTAVEIDPGIAELARYNLPGARVLCGDAESIAPDLLERAGPDTAVMLDPARRTGRGRSWRIEDIRPSWGFVVQTLGSGLPVVVKLGPGVPREILPGGVAVTWVGQGRDLVEAAVWAGSAGQDQPSQSAVLVADDGTGIALVGGEPQLEAGPVGEFLAEPHPAALRARALRAAAGVEVHVPSPGIGYLLADRPAASPWLTWFRICERMPLAEKTLRGWVREHRVGALEIKVRGLDVDPAGLRRRLHPKGPNRATFILTPTSEGARALVAERPPG